MKIWVNHGILYYILCQSLNALTIIKDNPSVDYTPPAYITLLFTDLGVLTSSGVSDELSE